MLKEPWSLVVWYYYVLPQCLIMYLPRLELSPSGSGISIPTGQPPVNLRPPPKEGRQLLYYRTHGNEMVSLPATGTSSQAVATKKRSMGYRLQKQLLLGSAGRMTYQTPARSLEDQARALPVHRRRLRRRDVRIGAMVALRWSGVMLPPFRRRVDASLAVHVA